MADNTIDTLELKIVSDAGRAEQSIKRLTDSLIKLASSTGRGLNNLRTVSGDIKSLNNATKALDTSRLSAYAKGIDNLSSSIEKFATLNGKITPALNALSKLANVNLSNLQFKGDFSGLSSLADGVKKLADVAPKISELKASDLNRTLAAFQKLGQADFSNVAQSLQVLSGLDTTGFSNLSQAIGQFAESSQKLGNLGRKEINATIRNIEKLGTLNFSGFAQGISALNGIDLSQLTALGQAFQSFSSALSNSDKIATNTTKIFSSLATLATSAGNIPAIISHMPGLSTELSNFLNVMSATPAIETNTANLVSALANLSNAGAKAGIVVSALPGLTDGIKLFIETMASLPKLDNNILKAVESLSRLASAGRNAGTASKDLLNAVNRLSGSMGRLRNGTLGAIGGLRSLTTQLLSALGFSAGLYGIIRAVKSSINTFSNLVEVQNVVNKSFGEMTYKMENLSKVSIADFGMSELTAKQIASRYQAMGVAMGFAQDEMSNMSIELTKLAADMASFYNVEQEAVAESLESIFTGQTRPLRTYGLDLTQATLQEWAMKQGIDANMKSMSQAEKTLLRYQYVLAQTQNIAGDFRDTQGSWANQTRILSEQFKQLGSILGGGLVAALLPAVKALNIFMSKIIQVAQTIASFLSGLLRIKGTAVSAGAGLAQTSDFAGDLANNSEDASEGISNIGGSAKKAKKDLNSFAASWHEVTNMNSDNSDGASGSGGALSMPKVSLPSEYHMDVTADDKVSPILGRIQKRFNELAGLFMIGFHIGLGDTSVFTSIKQNLQSIKESLLDTFTDDTVVKSFNHMIDKMAFNAGLKTGASVFVGTAIIDNLTGGIALYLDSAKERIKEWLISMFDITTETDTILTNFTVAIADIFTIFRSDDAKSITSDIIQLFADGFLGVSELAAKLGRDVLGLILTPIIENADGFKEALGNVLSFASEILGTLANSFTSLWETIQKTYDEHARPTFESFTKGISKIVKSLLDGFNEYISPVLDSLGKRFTEVWDGTLHPLLENFIGLFGDLADLVKAVWEGIFLPIINWIAKAIMPLVAPILDALGNEFFMVFENIGTILNDFITILRGAIQFLTGFFSREWEKVWEGIKTTFKGIWNALVDFLKVPIRSIIGSVNQMIKSIQYGINFVIKALSKLEFDIPDWVPGIGGESFGFSIKEISLPMIPQLAQGGVLKKGQWGFLEGNGDEAVMPLSKNTEWMDNVAKRMSSRIIEDFGHLQLDLSVPEIRDYKPRNYDMGALQNKIQMELDAQLAQRNYETSQQNELLREQNELLKAILNKPTLQSKDVFSAVRKEANGYIKQYKHDPWPVMGRNW